MVNSASGLRSQGRATPYFTSSPLLQPMISFIFVSAALSIMLGTKEVLNKGLLTTMKAGRHQTKCGCSFIFIFYFPFSEDWLLVPISSSVHFCSFWPMHTIPILPSFPWLPLTVLTLHSCISLFSTYLLNTFCSAGTILGIEDTALNKMEEIFSWSSHYGFIT